MNTKLCPTCKTPIPAHAPGGFCPACILRDADELPPLGRTAPSLEDVRAAFPQLEVLELIGQGGMGFVYKARQPSLDRTVALKILSPELGRDPAFAERFAREARVLGKLNHPNIVTVFEHGESCGFFYLIMEHVDGVNLRQAMRAGRFTPAQALAVVPGICDALGAAHAQGVWHRDIKPENILLDAQGGVKIVDFGIARIVGDPQRDFTLTMTGAALGSAAYMAPEQHESPHSVDHRADIYSLGVVIYEMLTGELPLGRFPAPSERAAVSARIDEIVFQTLEKERHLRQQSAEEVKTDVHRAAKHVDAKTWNRGDLPAKVTLWALGLILAGLLFGGAGAGIFLIGETMRNGHSWLVAGVSIFAIGAIAFVLGFAGACYALWQMHRGLIPPVWRPLLRVLTVVPWPLEIAERCWSNADDVSPTSRAVVIAILTGGVAAGVAALVDEFQPRWSENGHFFITGLLALTGIVGIGRLGWSRLLRHDGVGAKRTAFWAGFAALVFTIVGAIEAKRFDGQWPTSYSLVRAEIRLTDDSSLTDARLQQAYEIAAGPYKNKHRMQHGGQTIHLSVVGLEYLSGDNVPAATLLNSLIRRFFETLDDTERASIKSIETFGGDRHMPRTTRQAVYIVLLSGIGLAGVIIVTVGRRGLWARFAMCASVLAIGFVLPVWRSSAISPFTPDPAVGPALADISIAQRSADFSTPVGAVRALCDAALAGDKAGVLAAITPEEREADENPDDYARMLMATYAQGRAAFSKPRSDLGTQVIVPTKFFVFQNFGANGELRAVPNDNQITCVKTPDGWRVKTHMPPKNRRKVAVAPKPAETAKLITSDSVMPMRIHFLPGNRLEVDGKAATADELVTRLKQPNDGKTKWRFEVETEAGVEGRFIADVIEKMQAVGAKFDEDVIAKLRDSMKASTYSILGQVNKPGQMVSPDDPITVSKAITLAGGPTRLAALEKVQLRRTDAAGAKKTITVDVKKVLEGKATKEEDPVLEAGDMIAVPEQSASNSPTPVIAVPVPEPPQPAPIPVPREKQRGGASPVELTLTLNRLAAAERAAEFQEYMPTILGDAPAKWRMKEIGREIARAWTVEKWNEPATKAKPAESSVVVEFRNAEDPERFVTFGFIKDGAEWKFDYNGKATYQTSGTVSFRNGSEDEAFNILARIAKAERVRKIEGRPYEFEIIGSFENQPRKAREVAQAAVDGIAPMLRNESKHTFYKILAAPVEPKEPFFLSQPGVKQVHP